MNRPFVRVIGGGLAGCEAAYAVARRGVPVLLTEMKPKRFSPAHRSPFLAELVCSNSFKANRTETASGLLKEELRRMGSVCMRVADACAVPAGGALAVDRELFSAGVTKIIDGHPLISRETAIAERLPEEGIAVVATGPLTEEPLAGEIDRLCGGTLHFYDAAAPIVEADSVDARFSFRASRYGREESGEGDYINCPLNREEYEAFHAALAGARRASLRDFDRRVYEGCMPVEILAERGLDALRFGPMKPVGLTDPRTGRRPWAVLQLRKENAAGNLLNMVGFQTNLTFGEQKRVFGMIPALREAVFARYGVMHRNAFIDSPRLLERDQSLKTRPDLFFAGQLTGVEGYMESAASGLLAGRAAARRQKGLKPETPPPTTMSGALTAYIADPSVADFQPMGANFGILPPLPTPVRDKRRRAAAFAKRALDALEPFREEREVEKTCE